MSGPRVLLRCMNGSGGSSSPGTTIDCHLPSGGNVKTTTHVIHTNGDVQFKQVRHDDEQTKDVNTKSLLAEIQSSGLSVLFKAYVDECFVETPPASRLSGTANTDRIEVPKSVTNIHHWIHLRPDDTLSFANHGIKICVGVEVLSRSQLASHIDDEANTSAHESEAGLLQDDILVKSSNVGEDEGEATDSGAEDLDDVPAFVADNITPSKSYTEAEPAIKETPNTGMNRAGSLANTDDDVDERAVYSTARNDKVDEGSVSPSVQAKARLIPLESISMAEEMKEANSTSDRSLADVLDEEVLQPAKTRVTYSQRTKKSISPESLSGPEVPSVETADSEPERSVVHGESATEDNMRQVMTSDALDGSEVAEETAKRSMKRKSAATTEDSEQSTGSKKRKVKAELNDSGDQTPPGSAPSTRSSSRLKKPTRQSPERDTEFIEEEITVATGKKRKTSPQVVIKQRKSESPSSTATSPMIGKTPKVLLARESALRRSASRWLKDKGSEILHDVPTKRSHFVCVVDGSIKTAKVLRSLALGKKVVTEDWIVDSKKAGRFLDPDDYVHPELSENTSNGRHRLFLGHTLFFTNTLADKVYMSGWKDIQNLAQEAGASSVHKGSSGDYAKYVGRQPVICFGADNNDADVGRLQAQHERTVYRRSLISHALISGELDLDDEEFHLPAGGSGKKS